MIPALVITAIAHVDAAAAALLAARENLQRALRAAATAAYLSADMRTVTDLVHELYWNTEIGTDYLTTAFGVNAQFAADIAGPLPSGIHCPSCSSPVPFTSRAQRARLGAPSACDRCHESPQREGTARGRRRSAMAQLQAEMQRRQLIAAEGPPGATTGEEGGGVGTDSR